jgi:hypothetical protein
MEDMLAFLLGLITGVFVIMVILFLSFVRSGKKEYKISIKGNESITQIEAEELVSKQYKEFKRVYKSNENEDAFVRLLYKHSYGIIEEISKRFYPKSKYPLLELSLSEIVLLLEVISSRLQVVLSKPMIRLTKDVKLSQIVYFYKLKKDFDEGSMNKILKKYKVTNVVKTGLMALNITNPFYWLRKAVFKFGGDAVFNQTIKVTLDVVAEEAIKLYSKKIFQKEPTLDLVNQNLLGFDSDEQKK